MREDKYWHNQLRKASIDQSIDSLTKNNVKYRDSLTLMFCALMTYYIIALELNASLFWSSPEVIQAAPFAWYGKLTLNPFKNCFLWFQSRCSIYSHFFKPLHQNIHKFWHQALTVMKIAVEDFQKINSSTPHFLHLTSINCSALKIRLFWHVL